MNVSKTARAFLLLAILALVGAVVVAGCGGGDSSSTPETTAEEAPAPAEEEAAEESEEANEEAADQENGANEGKAVFTANCASCHTLKAAGATGEVGPNLDELMPDDATVEKQVTNGGGGMPAFGGTLSPAEIKEVAAFVSSEAGK